jgi:Tol biopolymer transport system component/cytosine/adenosine deaminase-related metal-dependent hydrolase
MTPRISVPRAVRDDAHARRHIQGDIKMMHSKVAAAAVISFAGLSLSCSRAAGKGDNHELPLEATRTVDFTTTVGSAMSVDVSPDGKTIIFDLLGDLYTVPITGGDATQLTRGMGWDQTPKFSPDGKYVAFVSDRSGMVNLWMIDSDGSHARRLSQYTDVTDPRAPNGMGRPFWSADGRAIIAQAGSTEDEMPHSWRYELSGGAPMQLMQGRPHLTFGGASTGDGSAYWFGFAEGVDEYRRSRPTHLAHLDIKSGRIDTIAVPWQTAYNPIISPDGKWLVYASHEGTSIGDAAGALLRIRAIEASVAGGTAPDERAAARAPDTAGTANVGGGDAILVPSAVDSSNFHWSNYYGPCGYAFTPDSRAVVFTAGGKIRRVELATRAVSEIPFSAHVRVDLAPLVRHASQIDFGPLSVKQLRSVNASPDGTKLVFSAVGRIWIATRTSDAAAEHAEATQTSPTWSTPKRLTRDSAREYDPIFSPDGRWIAYVTWSDIEGGRLWKIPVDGGTPAALTPVGAVVTMPRWTPDGNRIVFLTGKNPYPHVGTLSQYSLEQQLGKDKGPFEHVAVVAADGGTMRLLAPYHTGSGQSLGVAGGRVFFTDMPIVRTGRMVGSRYRLKSVGLDSGDVRTHAQIDDIRSPVIPSPDGRWLAIEEDFTVAVIPFDSALRTGSQDSSADVPALKLRTPQVRKGRLSKEGGVAPIWSADGKWLSWSWINQFSRVAVSSLGDSSRTASDVQVSTVLLTVPRQVTTGSVLLRGARLVTMSAAGLKSTPAEDGGVRVTTDPMVIERGDLLIEGPRIKALGPTGSLTIPPGTEVIDVSGKTIVPGYIVGHEHRDLKGTIIPQVHSGYASRLAHGMTTVPDPYFGWTSLLLDEMVEAGELIGPRWVGTLGPFVTEVAPASQEEAFEALRKHKAAGGFFMKEYASDHRIRHQWLAIAANREGLVTTAEGMPFATHALDGYADIKHGFYPEVWSTDLVQLIARSGTSTERLDHPSRATTTAERERQTKIIERYAQEEWYPPSFPRNVDWENGQGNRRRVPDDRIIALAKLHAEFIRAGGILAVGPDMHDTKPDGALRNHQAVWTLAGGMTNAEALRVFTFDGARVLGLERELGSLEPGKVADMVILNSNPLDDIHNTIDIAYVVKGGELREARTLDAIWPKKKKFPRRPWQGRQTVTLNAPR